MIHSGKIKILYFTDPICSTCWVVEPYIDKLLVEYGSIIELENVMVGLLPNWDLFEPESKKVPKELYLSRLWEHQAKKHERNIDGNIWLNNPIQSSFPPSIAYYAALEQGKD